MIFLLLLIYVGAEIAAFVVVAENIGLLLAILLVLVISALGPFLVRRAGLGVLEHARGRLARGESPTPDLLDGVVLLLAGALVCIPGFIGDVIGGVLLIGPVRRRVSRWSGRALARHLQSGLVMRVGGANRRGGPVIDVSGHGADLPGPSGSGEPSTSPKVLGTDGVPDEDPPPR